MSELAKYINDKTERGECNCGRCFDRGSKPDPSGHVADLIFFKVAARNQPTLAEFRRLTKAQHGEFNAVNPFDGNEHGYMELGGWLGDQGLALRYMGLGALLGAFYLLTPRTVLPSGVADEAMVMEMAGTGLVSIQAKASESTQPLDNSNTV